MTEERYSPLMLTSDHKRILSAAQERYDKSMSELYERGRWDGVAIGLFVGFIFTVLFCLGLLAIVEGWTR